MSGRASGQLDMLEGGSEHLITSFARETYVWREIHVLLTQDKTSRVRLVDVPPNSRLVTFNLVLTMNLLKHWL